MCLLFAFHCACLHLEKTNKQKTNKKLHHCIWLHVRLHLCMLEAGSKTLTESSTGPKEADSATADAKASALDLDNAFPGDASKASGVVDNAKTDVVVSVVSESRSPKSPSFALSGITAHLKTTFIGEFGGFVFVDFGSVLSLCLCFLLCIMVRTRYK